MKLGAIISSIESFPASPGIRERAFVPYPFNVVAHAHITGHIVSDDMSAMGTFELRMHGADIQKMIELAQKAEVVWLNLSMTEFVLTAFQKRVSLE